MGNTKEKRYDVFISHSSKDNELAIEIYKYLSQNNVKCWLDKCSILPGEPYSASIMKGLNDSQSFMLLYTKNAIGSQHILNEIDNAYNKNKHILTYVVDKTPMSEELNYYLSRPQQIHSYPNYKEKLPVLLSAIKSDGVEQDSDIKRNAEIFTDGRKKNWLWILLPLLIIGILYVGFTIYQNRNLFLNAEIVCADTINNDLDTIDKIEVIETENITTATVHTPQIKPTTQPKSTSQSIGVTNPPVKQNQAPVVSPTPKEETSKSFAVGGVSFKMIKVEGGTFLMGASVQDTEAYPYENPVHPVEVDGFYVAETEVTQALWYAVLGLTIEDQQKKKKINTQLRGVGDSYPIYYVSYEDCIKFINTLNRITNQKFRLLTEAEWEYVARGGNKKSENKFSGSQIIENVAWYQANSDNSPHPVAAKSPNDLGIYDMTGNVSEWCSDWFDTYTDTMQINPKGAEKGTFRVYRGGSWYDKVVDCRVTCRVAGKKDYRSSDLGLRLALPK